MFADGQILEREQAHGAVQGAEPDRSADKDVVPEQADQVEEAAGVQAEDRAPARILPTGAALRVAFRATLLLPGGGCGSGDGRVHSELIAVRYRRCASKLRLRSSATATADDHFDGTRRVTGARRGGDGGGRTSSGPGQNGTPTPSPSPQPPPSTPPTEIK